MGGHGFSGPKSVRQSSARWSRPGKAPVASSMTLNEGFIFTRGRRIIALRYTAAKSRTAHVHRRYRSSLFLQFVAGRGRAAHRPKNRPAALCELFRLFDPRSWLRDTLSRSVPRGSRAGACVHAGRTGRRELAGLGIVIFGACRNNRDAFAEFLHRPGARHPRARNHRASARSSRRNLADFNARRARRRRGARPVRSLGAARPDALWAWTALFAQPIGR